MQILYNRHTELCFDFSPPAKFSSKEGGGGGGGKKRTPRLEYKISN